MKKYLLGSFLLVAVVIGYYVQKNIRGTHDKPFTSEVIIKNKRASKPEIVSEHDKTQVEPPSNFKEEEPSVEDLKKMSTEDYLAWLKDKKGRVLIDSRVGGFNVYRKKNVTISVLPDGEELYLPDEI